METKAENYIRESLRYWLKELDINQDQASKRCHIARSTINKILSGKLGVNFKNAELISKGLNTTIEEMIKNGKQLLGDDPETEHLNAEQIQALEAFGYILKNQHDSAAKLIVKNVLAYVKEIKDRQQK